MRPAGDFTQRVTLQAPALAGLDDGDSAETFADAVGPLWACVEELGGKEIRRGEQPASEHTHRVTIRWRAGVTSALRVRWGTRLLDIDGVSNPDGRKEDLLLQCIEVA
jgi:SPP1 family predicted phage head-tail adaptor